MTLPCEKETPEALFEFSKYWFEGNKFPSVAGIYL